MCDEIMKELSASEILEAKPIKFQLRRRSKINNLLAGIVVAVLASALAATMLLPVLRISGGGMVPTLADGDLVVTASVTEIAAGVVGALY